MKFYDESFFSVKASSLFLSVSSPFSTIFPTVSFLSFLRSSSFPFARCALVLSVSLPVTVFTAARYRDRTREKGDNILSLFYSSVSGSANDWREQGRHRQNREEYECGEVNAADCRVPFFPPFLPSLQQLLPLPSFVRSFVRPSSSSSLFLSLRASAYKAIPRAFHPKKAGTRAAARWEPRPGLSRIWNIFHTMISARGTPGRVVRNNFLDDLTTGRCSERTVASNLAFGLLFSRHYGIESYFFRTRADLSFEK